LSIVVMDISLSCLHDPAVRVFGVGFKDKLQSRSGLIGL
jgi:hypothetical protein